MIVLGDLAPDFAFKSNLGSFDSFRAWKGDQWCILFSHPADFTPVCTTELGMVAKLMPEFEKRQTKVIGLSCDDVESHAKWIQDINETQNCKVTFPIIDDSSRHIASVYGMLDKQDDTNKDKHGMPLTVRSVFIIDPKHVIRLMITYPASCGRNFDEILRSLDSLQLTDKYPVATPANWTSGNNVIVHVSLSDEKAKQEFGHVQVVKPYLRFTKCPQ